MAVTNIDARGLQCPQPTLKVTAMSVKMKPGDVLEVVADCATFEKDVKEWCTRSKEGDALDEERRKRETLPDSILMS